MVRPIVIMVETASDESLGRVRYGQVNCRCLSRVAQGPEGWYSPGKAPLEFPRLEEVNQLGRLSHKHVMNLIITPCGVVAIEISRQNEPGRLVCCLGGLLNSGLNFV